MVGTVQKNKMNIMWLLDEAPCGQNKIIWLRGAVDKIDRLSQSRRAIVAKRTRAEALQQVRDMLESGRVPFLIYFDDRSVDLDLLLELRNGRMFSDRYGKGRIMMPPPHIVVASDRQPDLPENTYEIYDCDIGWNDPKN